MKLSYITFPKKKRFFSNAGNDGDDPSCIGGDSSIQAATVPRFLSHGYVSFRTYLGPGPGPDTN